MFNMEEIKNLQERVKRYKQESGCSYKDISIDLDLPLSTLYNFTSSGRMKYCHQIKLNDYLLELGY